MPVHLAYVWKSLPVSNKHHNDSTTPQTAAPAHPRLDGDSKQKLERAAAYANRSLSEFVLSRGLDAADAVILEYETLGLSDGDWQVFLDALEDPPEPNARLCQAFAEDRKRVQR